MDSYQCPAGFLKGRGLSAETLAFLHQTHGYDPETVADFATLPAAMLREYELLMEAESQRSRTAFTPKIITTTP